VIEPVPISLPLLHPNTTQLTHVACGRAHTVIVTDKEGGTSLLFLAVYMCGRWSVVRTTHCVPDTLLTLTLTPDSSPTVKEVPVFSSFSCTGLPVPGVWA